MATGNYVDDIDSEKVLLHTELNNSFTSVPTIDSMTQEIEQQRSSGCH